MLRLFYANKTERLVDQLVDDLNVTETATNKLLSPTAIVVRNHATEVYLKHRIAQQKSIAFHLKFFSLENYLEHLSNTAALSAKLIRTDRLLLELLEFLSSTQTQHPTLQSVHDYLFAAGPEAQLVDRRRFQLAKQLSRLFRHRAMEVPHIEAHDPQDWPSALWSALMAQRGANQKTLAEWTRHILPALQAASCPTRSFVFLWPVQHQAEKQALYTLGQKSDVLIYSLNPCREFWDDLDLKDKTSLLSVWGTRGHNQIRNLNEITHFDFVDLFEQPTSPAPASTTESAPVTAAQETELIQIQQALFYRATTFPSLAANTDASLKIWSSLSIRHEAELIAQEIWALLADPAISLTDVGIAIASDTERYRAHLRSALQIEGTLSLAEVDMPLSPTSHILEAVELMLALPFAHADRQKILQFLSHPCVAQATGYQLLWQTWCEELAILHGEDRTAFHDTYVEHDLYNWEQALRRIWLGTVLAQTDEPELHPLGEDSYLPLYSTSDQLSEVAQFVACIRALLDELKQLEQASLPLAQWMDWIRRLLHRYFRAATEDETRDLHRVHQFLERIEAQTCEENAPDVTTTPFASFGFTLVAELLRDHIQSLRRHSGSPAQSVVMAPLPSIAALPFRFVFVCGLNAASFPGTDAEPHFGQSHPTRAKRDEQLYAFLERLISTRERLYLSYVGYDAITGDNLEPSSVIHELNFVRGYQEPATTPQPMHPDDNEDYGVALRSDLSQHLHPIPPTFSLADLAQNLPPQQKAQLCVALKLQAWPQNAKPSAQKQNFTVPLWLLQKFLVQPFEAWALFARQFESEALEQVWQHEPFQTPPAQLRTWMIDSVLAHPDEPEFSVKAYQTLQTKLALAERTAKAPTGFFRTLELTQCLATLQSWQTCLQFSFPGPVALRRAYWGTVNPVLPNEQHLPPLSFAAANTLISLSGQSQPLVADEAYTFSPQLGTAAPPSPALELACFVEHLLLVATGVRAENQHARCVFAYRTPEPQTFRFAGISAEAAKRALCTLLTDFIGNTHTYTFDLNQIYARLTGKKPHKRQPSSSVTTANESPTKLSRAEFEALCENRYALFFQLREQE